MIDVYAPHVPHVHNEKQLLRLDKQKTRLVGVIHPAV